MIKTSINTFGGGMNKDLDKSLLPANKYIDAQNYRIFTTEGSTTGSLENIKGTKFILERLEPGVDTIVVGHNYLVVKSPIIYNTVTLQPGQTFIGSGVSTYSGDGYVYHLTGNIVGGYIIGSCQLRDDIILFTTLNTTITPTNRDNRIYKLRINLDIESQSSLTLLYNDLHNTDGSSLRFSTVYPIKAIAKYETPNVQKVYWTDGYNDLRFANIVNPLTVTGSAYVTSGDYMAVDKFELLPKVTASKPKLKSVIGGRIKSGIVAYAYQLYVMNGSETVTSPTSDPISVVSDNDFLSNTLNYKGDEKSVNSGKGFIISIANADNGYNRLRLIRITYEYINSLPEISVAADIAISTNPSTIEISDVGDTIYEMTIDEFNLMSTEAFSCQDIATKDNRLFVANIKKSDFECDAWDSRAVRFRLSDGLAKIYNENIGTSLLRDFTNWDNYTEKHDGINIFNDPDNDSSESSRYIYQSNLSTIGAEGPNIKLDFETAPIILDVSNNDRTFYANAPTDSKDLSYSSYASVWKGGKLSWQRDEVYRLFVVFGNNKGQTADPKWICDLRMPSLHDIDHTNGSGTTVKPSALAELSGTTIRTNRLYPRIYFKSFPTNATWAQIYRVKRDRADRSVVTQGYAIPLLDNGDTVGLGPKFDLASNNYYTDGKEILKIVSPDININRNISKQANDYIEYVTKFTSYTWKEDVGSWPILGNLKIKANTRIDYAINTRSSIKDAFVVYPASTSSDYVLIDGKKFINYGNFCKGSTGLLVCYDNTAWSAENETCVLVNYKSKVFSSQYGGNTYEDRMANISIPCSDIITLNHINTWINIEAGDTFINFFDIATTTVDLAEGRLDAKPNNLFVPVESSINCDLRHDTSSYHMTYTNSFAKLRQEYAGKHSAIVTTPDKPTVEYEQEKDLYLYNTVYSQQVDVKSAVSLIVDKTLETKFDCMIKASNNKANGEITDSWTKFAINEFIEVDSTYGPINALNVANNKLLYFQDKAFGVLSVNERSLISDSNSSQLVLGTGGVLDRFDYFSNVLGCKDKFSIVNGLSGVYWYDRINNYIVKFSDAIDKISLSKGVQSYLNQNVLSNQSVIAHADISNSEVLFTFFIGGNTLQDDAFTLSYNENFDAFISFYSFIPNIYIPFNNRYLTTTRSRYCDNQFNLNYLFLHDSNIYPRCNFYSLYPYDHRRYFDCSIKVVHNQDYMYTKTWDNILVGSNVYYNGVELYDQSINSMRCYNDFQNTDYISLAYKTNLERRERGWITVVPRNAVDADLTTNPNIFDPGNLNQYNDRLHRERLRDKYMITDIVYRNSDLKDKIVLNNVGTKYRLSYR